MGFAAAEQAESFMMVKYQRPYNNSTKILSPRQIDYATSNNGILNYQNEHGLRDLASSGNFYISSEILSYGLSLIDEAKMPFEPSGTKKELSDVLNFANSNYEVNSTINLPAIFERTGTDYGSKVAECNDIIDTDEAIQCIQNYENEIKTIYFQKIKEGIKNYGGAVVETMPPLGKCSFNNTDGNQVVDATSSCYATTEGHAMQLIGWDDNYTYSYCKGRYEHTDINNDGTCTEGIKTEGKGAFILRNSWGEAYPYAYLTYESINSEKASAIVHFITDMTYTSDRNWSNLYKKEVDYSTLLSYMKSITQSFEKKIKTDEKLEKVKFNAYTADGTYSILISDGEEQYRYNNVLSTNFPGIYTIDLSDKNIVLENDTFSITIFSNNGYALKNSISAFTSNVDKTPIIEILNPKYGLIFDDPKESSHRFLYQTKNIESNEVINLSLETENGEDVSNYLHVENNIVAKNNANPLVTIDALPVGKYYVVASYGNAKIKTSIKVNKSTVTISYYANNGTTDHQDQEVKKATEFTLMNNPFTKEGYTFKEWNTEADGSGTVYENNATISNGVEANLTLYAIWTPKPYQITFDSNGGTGSMDNQTIMYDETKELNNNSFTRPGYTFKEWNTETNGSGTSYSNKQQISINNNLTLYAIWIPIEYEIMFIANTGTGTMSNLPMTYDVAKKLTKSLFTKEGYTFAGWNTKRNGSGVAYSDEQEVLNLTTEDSTSIILYAQWKEIPKTKVSYTTHVQNVGWQSYVSNGAMSGTSGKSLRLEGIKIKLENAEYSGNIEYRTHIQNIGWESRYKKNNEMSGTSGQSLRLEAIKIRLTGEVSEHYDVYYRVHAENFGWLGWARNGESSGTAGYGYRLEGIEIILITKGTIFNSYGEQSIFVDAKNGKIRPIREDKLIAYTTHVEKVGWQEYVTDGLTAGTSGRSLRLEGIKIKLNNPKYSGDVEYKTHIQNIGWESRFKKNDEMSGTSGKALRLEAIKIQLTGDMADNYDIYYRVHAQNFGWLYWAKNGEPSGTAGYGYRLEGIEIVLVNKGEKPPKRNNQQNINSFLEKK